MLFSQQELEMMQIIRLISAIHRMQENTLDRYAQANWGLTAGQLRLVLTLLPNQPLRTLELAKRLYTDPGTVSGLLRRLTRKGIVTCRQSSNDRRVQLVSLTAQGQQVRAQYYDRAPAELPTHRFTVEMAEGERRTLLASLTKYASHLMGGEEVGEFLETVGQANGV